MRLLNNLQKNHFLLINPNMVQLLTSLIVVLFKINAVEVVDKNGKN